VQIDRYQVRSEIARGGFGAVYRAWDPSLQREVAIKLLLDHRDEEEVERFLREGQAATRLSHPNVLKVLGGGNSQGRPYLVLELVDGPTLTQRIEREGELLVVEAVDLAIALTGGVEAAHQAGVLHRDLKPQNVLFQDGRPLLTDFGIARVANARSLTQTGELLGTPGYMAPEQIEGDKSRLGPATDVYGLGAILFASLTGRAPFEAPTVLGLLDKVLHSAPPPPSSLRPEVDRGLDAICLRALAREPGERYASAAALGAALQDWSTPAAAPATSKGSAAKLIAVLVLVGLLALGVGLAFRAGLPPAPTPTLSPTAPTHTKTPAPTPQPLPSQSPARATPSPSPSDSPPAPRSSKGALLLAQARKLRGHDPDQALALMIRAARETEVRCRALIEQALLHIERGALEPAGRCLNQTKGLAGTLPDIAFANYVAGRLFFHHGDTARARDQLRKAVRIQRLAPYLAWLGVVSPKDERQQLWEEAHALAPEDPAVLYLEYRQGHYSRSRAKAETLLAKFERALTRAPASPKLAIHVGRLHWFSQQATPALRKSRDALIAWPELPEAYLEAGWISAQMLHQVQPKDQARWLTAAHAAFSEGLKRFPKHVGLLRERAALYLMERRFREAFESHQRLLELERPPSAWTLHNTYLASRRFLANAVARRDFQGLEDPRPVAKLAHEVLDRMASKAMNNYLASRSYGKAPEQTHADLQVLLGRALGIMRRWEDAREVLDLEVTRGHLSTEARYYRYLNREERARYTLDPLPTDPEREADWKLLLTKGHRDGVADSLEGRALRKLSLPSQSYLDKVTAQDEGLRLQVELCRAMAAKPYLPDEEAALREQIVKLRPYHLLSWHGLLRHRVRSQKPVAGILSYKTAPDSIQRDPLIRCLAGELLSLSAVITKHEMEGRFAKAEEAFAGVLELEPKFDTARGALFAHYLRRRDPKGARRALESLEGRLSQSARERFLRHIRALEEQQKR
jgi:serine/threonine protein kinase/tetratricopeptide (TPR) repeat protein